MGQHCYSAWRVEEFLREGSKGGDAYLLSHVIHAWSEEQCLAILGNCRRAMKPTHP